MVPVSLFIVVLHDFIGLPQNLALLLRRKVPELMAVVIEIIQSPLIIGYGAMRFVP